MKSRWTLLLIPEDNNEMRKIRISSTLVIFSIMLIVGITAFSVYSGHRLYDLRSDLGRVDAIKDHNDQQSRQLELLSEKISRLDTEMVVLRNYNHHLSTLANVDTDAPEEIIGVGGGEAAEMKSEVMTEKILTRRLHSNMKQLEDDIEIEKQVSRDLLSQIERQRSLLAHTPSTWPVRGWVSSKYGWRSSPFTGRREFHKGMDIAARYNTPIYAPADGIVTSCKRNGGYGNFLAINHGYGIVTRYGHLKSATVKVGQQVSKGEMIAHIGSTGRSTGPHLHYEVMVNGIHVNPRRYMLK